MKRLTEYIIEKFKISKDIDIKPDIEVRFNIDESGFTKEEVNEILKSCYKLPILPNYLSKGQNTRQFINLIYEPNEKKKDIGFGQKHVRSYNIIRIRKDNGENNYLIRFMTIDTKETWFYPEDSNQYYHKIKEVFDGILKHWKDTDIEECIKKYQ